MTKYNADDFDSMRNDIDSEPAMLQCWDILLKPADILGHIEGTASSAATHESICGFSATLTGAGAVTFDLIPINR